ncbi:MAG: MOP flippase family protein [Bryobacter sp.]|nr:MOP flippase family protein [Bryobacter sp.]
MKAESKQEGLGQAAARGARWMALATASLTLISLAQNMTLSRLLEARELGLVGMLWAALGLAQVFHDMGLGNAVVQRKEVSEQELSTVFWLSAAMGGVLCGFCVLAGPLLAAYYREPELAALAPWVGGAFLAQSLGQTFRSVGQRELRFGWLSGVDVVSAAVGLGVSTGLAMNGWGAKSLLVATVAGSVVRSGLMAWGQRDLFWPGWQCRPGEIGAMLNFGLYQMGDKSLNYLGANIDYILIGRVWGAEPLAIYRLAYETAVRPLSIINPIFNSVAYPIFSRKQDDAEALRNGLEQGLRMVAGLGFPLLAGLAVTADWAVKLLYGPKWEAVGPVLAVLCGTGALRCVTNLAGSILLAKGLARRSFWLTVFNLALFSAAYGLAVQKGIEAMAWASVGVVGIVVVATYGWIYGETIRMPVRQYAGALAGAAMASLGMGCGVWGLRVSGWMSGWDWGWQFAAAVAAGTVLYAGLSAVLQPQLAGALYRIAAKRG